MGKGGGDEVRFQLAVILDKRGKFPDAEKELLGLIASSPKHAQALNYLGYSWADKGVKLPDAEALIRRALAVEPGNRFYLDSLGWALYKQGRSKEALDPLQQASKGLGKDEDADEAVVFDHLSTVQTELGQLSAAKESRARAEEIRSRAGARGAGGQEDNDPAKEPGL
jgi:predicted Zn-dependent protease